MYRIRYSASYVHKKRYTGGLGDHSELFHTRVLDPAFAEVGHVGAAEDAARGPLELDAAPFATVLVTVGFQETLELQGDVRQVLPSHFLYARMINDTARRRPWARLRRSADGWVLEGCSVAELPISYQVPLNTRRPGDLKDHTYWQN